MKGITEKSLEKIISEGVENILTGAKMARRVEINIVVDRNSVPTISYKIDDFPIFQQPVVRTRNDE